LEARERVSNAALQGIIKAVIVLPKGGGLGKLFMQKKSQAVQRQ